MKSIIIAIGVIALTPFFCAMPAFAQSAFSLTNYTYTPTRLIIGTLRATTPASRCKLQGPTAKLFSLDKSNQLSISSEAASSDKPWYDIVIADASASRTKRDTFRVVNDTFIRNQVIAHRGAWKQLGTSENSIASLRNAVKLGCMGSEFDVHMSADSVLFVNHDGTIQGLAIEKTGAAELANVKLSNGEAFPTLAAYLQEGMKQTKTRLILEIKTSTLGKERSLALTERVVQLVHQLKAQAWVDYIAFDYDVCKKVKSLTPEAAATYLNGDKSPAQLAADQLNGFDYHQSIIRKNEAWIREAQQLKLTTNVWTVNTKADLSWLLDQHVDFITTNEPELLLTLVRP